MPFIQMVRQLSSDMKPKCETFLNESKELLRIGWILSIFMLLEYMLTSTSVIFCGQIGNTEMAAAGLAQSIISIFCFMPGYGMVTVCNTYFSAGFASKDDSRQGIILQKALLLSCIVTLPCWGILINTEGMLRLLHQKEDISMQVHSRVI
ncbi:multidrug and toxin extrusion protein 1-like [Anneissia japonica]|uniref:multidrug and toxin extrusion protein 1-like n=1 Tax=Anneissia japonica TaxID=1529436 RepID=UPI001425A696|nr:multidrug and toxin extrusion protein 1-like [Anneissia japonica]